MGVFLVCEMSALEKLGVLDMLKLAGQACCGIQVCSSVSDRRGKAQAHRIWPCVNNEVQPRGFDMAQIVMVPPRAASGSPKSIFGFQPLSMVVMEEESCSMQDGSPLQVTRKRSLLSALLSKPSAELCELEDCASDDYDDENDDLSDEEEGDFAGHDHVAVSSLLSFTTDSQAQAFSGALKPTSPSQPISIPSTTYFRDPTLIAERLRLEHARRLHRAQIEVAEQQQLQQQQQGAR